MLWTFLVVLAVVGVLLAAAGLVLLQYGPHVYYDRSEFDDDEPDEEW